MKCNVDTALITTENVSAGETGNFINSNAHQNIAPYLEFTTYICLVKDSKSFGKNLPEFKCAIVFQDACFYLK